MTEKIDILTIIESLTKDLQVNFKNVKEISDKMHNKTYDNNTNLLIDRIDQMSYYILARMQKSIAEALLKSLK